jgi:hypothetical protein
LRTISLRVIEARCRPSCRKSYEVIDGYANRRRGPIDFDPFAGLASFA